jgi:predicted GNAT family acetyltransferase
MTYLAVRGPDGSVISTGSILIVNGVANIWSVATTPAARGQGAATAITRACCIEAAKRGATVAALRTTDDLARPGGLYSNVGFELLGHEHIWELDNIDNLSQA